MDTMVFLAAAGTLVVVTYLIRLAGVWWGARLAGTPEQQVDGGPGADVRTWMDRATVVIILAVAATQTVFDGQDLSTSARMIGVGVGVAALFLRVPMIIAVLLAMGCAALLRAAGLG